MHIKEDQFKVNIFSRHRAHVGCQGQQLLGPCSQISDLAANALDFGLLMGVLLLSLFFGGTELAGTIEAIPATAVRCQPPKHGRISKDAVTLDIASIGFPIPAPPGPPTPLTTHRSYHKERLQAAEQKHWTPHNLCDIHCEITEIQAHKHPCKPHALAAMQTDKTVLSGLSPHQALITFNLVISFRHMLRCMHMGHLSARLSQIRC